MQQLSPSERNATTTALLVIGVGLILFAAGALPVGHSADAPAALAADPPVIVFATARPDPLPPVQSIQSDPQSAQPAPTAAPDAPPPAPNDPPAAPIAPVLAQVAPPAGSAAPVAEYRPPVGIEDWYTPPDHQQLAIDPQAMYDRAALAAMYRNLPIAGEPPSQADLDAAARQVYGTTRHSTGR